MTAPVLLALLCLMSGPFDAPAPSGAKNADKRAAWEACLREGAEGWRSPLPAVIVAGAQATLSGCQGDWKAACWPAVRAALPDVAVLTERVLGLRARCRPFAGPGGPTMGACETLNGIHGQDPESVLGGCSAGWASHSECRRSLEGLFRLLQAADAAERALFEQTLAERNRDGCERRLGPPPDVAGGPLGD